MGSEIFHTVAHAKSITQKILQNWKLKEACRLSTEQQHGAGCVAAPLYFTSDVAGEQPALFVKEEQVKTGFTCNVLLSSRHSNLLTTQHKWPIYNAFKCLLLGTPIS